MEKAIITSIKKVRKKPKHVWNLNVADNHNYYIDGVLVHNSPNIILDESSLISDQVYAKIFRMLGGHKDNFIFEIGNPFKRNHFYRDSMNDNFHHIFIDASRAVKEGRMKQSFVDEMKDKFDFGVMYECKFPDSDMVDMAGWTRVVTDGDIQNSFVNDIPAAFGEKRLGIDIARSGGNYTVFTIRQGNYAKIALKCQTNNVMEIIGLTREMCNREGVSPNNVFIDATGVGGGVLDRFREIGFNVTGVNMSSAAIDQDKYINIRAEAYLRLGDWIKKGGMLVKDSDWLELEVIKYKLKSSGKLQIISKEELRKNGIVSPDVADSLMLTFCRADAEQARTIINKFKINRINQPDYN